MQLNLFGSQYYKGERLTTARNKIHGKILLLVLKKDTEYKLYIYILVQTIKKQVDTKNKKVIIKSIGSGNLRYLYINDQT